jgi:hypothetical protein
MPNSYNRFNIMLCFQNCYEVGDKDPMKHDIAMHML